MKVKVNDKDKIVPVNCTVAMLAEITGINKEDSVAIAIGTDVIAREDWETIILKDFDKVTIIRATFGG
ncbi:MAG: sulfur carrier protein ThiS [Bacteroidales bacterium]|nr:sulfur carrier protein ThiS [Bacteroidales bacterium]